MTEAIVREVNCIAASTTEDAQRFDEAFPENALAFRAEFDFGRVEPGSLFVFDRGEDESPRFIFNLATRIHFKGEAKDDAIVTGIDAIVEAAFRHQVTKISIHRFEKTDRPPTNDEDLPDIESLAWWQDIKLNFLTSFARVPDIRLEFLKQGIAAEPKKKITIFTDGGAEPNPGVGGYGVVLRFEEKLKELSQGYRRTTNNRMELLAAIVGLESLKESCAVRLYSDSRYIVDAVATGVVFRWRSKDWKNGKVKNIDLWERFVLVYARHEVEMIWVKGHAGIADNERCDELATQAINSEDLLIDEEYEANLTEGSTKKKKKGKSKPANTNKKTPSKKTSKGAKKTSEKASGKATTTGQPADVSKPAPPTDDPPAKRGPKPKQVGDPCRVCALPLVRRETKKSSSTSAYYFPWHLHCESCNRIYHVEAAKVYRKKPSG